MSKRKRPDLEREFERGLGYSGGSVSFPGLAANSQSTSRVEEIPVSAIETTGNPRKNFPQESIAELADSIKGMGLLQPVTVRKRGDRYELIAGERRLRAFRLLKMERIPAIVKTVREFDPALIPEAKLVENIQREDLSPGETAIAVQSLVEAKGRGGQVEVARLIGRSKTWISQKVLHAKLVSIVPEAVRLDTDIAYHIASKNGETVWPDLVQDALSGPGARDRMREKEPSKKTGARSRTAYAQFHRTVLQVRKRWTDLDGEERKKAIRDLEELLREMKKG